MDGLPARRRVGAVLALSAGTALVALDGSVVTVALPTVARQLNVSASSAVFIVTLYQLVLITTIIPVGAIGDRVGFRTMYRRGLCLHLLGSAVCFLLSESLIGLSLGRALQALGTAGVLGMTAALVRSIYPRAWLGRGLSLNSVIVAVSTAAGPVISGILIGSGPWQVIFGIAIPACIIALLMSAALPDPVKRPGALNKRAAVLLSATVGTLVLSVQGLTSARLLPLAFAGIAFAFACGWAYVRAERAPARPYLPLALFSQPLLALSIAGAALASLASMAVMVVLPFILSDMTHSTPEQIGLMIAPWPLAMMIFGFCTGVLTDYIWPPLIGTVGAAICVVGFLVLWFLPEELSYFDFAWRAALCGAGLGIYLPTNGRLIVNAAPQEQMATAGSMISTSRMTAQGIGAALAAVLLHFGASGAAMPIAALLCGVALLFSSWRLRFRARAG